MTVMFQKRMIIRQNTFAGQNRYKIGISPYALGMQLNWFIDGGIWFIF